MRLRLIIASTAVVGLVGCSGDTKNDRGQSLPAEATPASSELSVAASSTTAAQTLATASTARERDPQAGSSDDQDPAMSTSVLAAQYALLGDEQWTIQEAFDPDAGDLAVRVEPTLDWYIEYVRTVGNEGQMLRVRSYCHPPTEPPGIRRNGIRIRRGNDRRSTGRVGWTGG